MEFKTAIFTKYLRTLYNVNLHKSNDIHATLIRAIFQVFIQMEEDINKMRLEICLTTASGEWLDLWGEYFGIPRLDNEIDEKYCRRMIAEIIEPKATISALKRGASRWLWLNFDEEYQENEIEAYEPWRDLLVTSTRGKVSYMGRLPDSVYWTHGVVDMAIPDSSEMSEELIKYLNTIKAAGVQLVWHMTMNWEVVGGYFETDAVSIYLEKWYDIWFKRENEITDGMRTLSPWYGRDESYNTPISVKGTLSGRQLYAIDIEIARNFEPFRFVTRETQTNPLIKLDYISSLNNISTEELTIQQLDTTELNADRQIPNVDTYTGVSYDEKVKEYSDKTIYDLNSEYLKTTTLDALDTTIDELIDKYDGDLEKLVIFVNDWNKLDYFNKVLNSSPLSNQIAPLQILTEEDA